jgi:peptide/nickel transport system substrate-binding protein
MVGGPDSRGRVRHSWRLMRVVPLAVVLGFACHCALAFNEVPELKPMVDAKTLPPVDQRLPRTPEIIQPYRQIGQYGGDIRLAMLGDGDYNTILRTVGVQGLTRWTIDFKGVVPNVAESITANADHTEYTFKLREGMKWSDGQPFTVDDVMFYVQDLLPNKAFFKTPPGVFVIKHQVMQGIKIDDTTFVLKFAAPYPTFLEKLASPQGQGPVLYAKHYCGQFHPKYATHLNELLRQSRANSWADLMRNKCGDIEIAARWGSTERPTLDPWVISQPYTGSATQVTLRRNPYFWQVDPAGNQLPYTDNLRFSVLGNEQTILLAAMNGRLDLQTRHIEAISNMPLLAEFAKKGGYKVMQMEDTTANAAGLSINQTTRNLPLRKLIGTPGFTEALSLATNRDEINQIVFLGQGRPAQIGPLPENRFYNAQLSTQFIQHDPAQANRILDGLGLTRRDGDGFRVYPGTHDRITMYAIASLAKPWLIEVLELIRRQWAAVGINVVIQSSERSLFYDRAQENNYDMSIDAIVGGLDPTQDMRAIISVHQLDSRQSIPWAKWYASGGKQGMEPSENMRERMKLLAQWTVEPDPQKADAMFRQILTLSAQAFEVIGTVTPPPLLGLHNVKLMNVFDTMPSGWSYATPGGSLPQQYYFAR